MVYEVAKLKRYQMNRLIISSTVHLTREFVVLKSQGSLIRFLVLDGYNMIHCNGGCNVINIDT